MMSVPSIVKKSESASAGISFKEVFDHSIDATLVILDGQDPISNQALTTLTGFTQKEISSFGLKLLMPKGAQSGARLRPLSLNLLEFEGTYEEVLINDREQCEITTEFRVRNSVSGAKILTFRDIGEKRRLENDLMSKHAELREAYQQLERKNAEIQSMQQALVQSGKMAALGELSAGIAHELNQPLQAIKGYAQELNAQGSSPFLKEIITGADKMAAIIKHLREFIRNSIESHELMDLRQPIEDALKLMTMEFKNNGIEVVKKIPADLPKIYGNPLSIEQVIINLATNARDAIIATHRGSGIIAIELKVAGQFVEILFSDNGTGMTEQTRKKAFDPFFTTKSVGKGMGLGLSLSFGMIEKVNGSIMIESEIGKGTVFKIRIPRDFREENL